MGKEAKKTTEDKLEAIRQFEENCDHLAPMLPVAQQAFADRAKGVMTLITTVMCSKCPHLFFDTQETNIKVRMAAVPLGEEEVEEKGGENDGSKQSN